ncbi:MAG: TIGR02452 family protein [Lachnoclostridium sp.]|nr:TIGR02452 family protein [Lachnoclostridium sp.]
MASQIALIEVFRDTQLQIKENPALRAEIRKVQAGSRLYLDQFLAMDAEVKCLEPKITVVADTTFHCAHGVVREGKKTAVLNFANAYNPGGGVKNGAPAQEEALCRCSNLYEALTTPYMIRHYYKWNQKNTGDMGSDRIIYTSNVIVFKSDDEIPEMLGDWFKVDVISCAAPYYDNQKKKPVSKEKLEEVFTNRIRNVLEVAIDNAVDNLVLGAFGCGAFNNPPELVANVFRKLLVDQRYATYFEKVIFAIKKTGDICTNYDTFRAVLEE